MDVHYWLALKYVPRLSVDKKLRLVEEVGLTSLFTCSDVDFSYYRLTKNQIHAFKQPNWQKVDQIIQACHQCHCQLISYSDMAYPDLLKQIFDPPLVLYVKGNEKLLAQEQLAIVGSRSASVYGKELTKSFAQQLSQQNIVVTSGLAIGIDGAAHQGVLLNQGQTIAVVATGLDIVYPARHRTLVKDIIANNGVIVSEFPPGTPPKAGHFPKRNRIISGLSKGVLVVEAELKSGSLITARTALEQNREIFAVPGSIVSLQSKGCHWLIKQGAKLVEEIGDITGELEFATAAPNLSVCSEILPLSQEADESKNFQNNVKQDLFLDALLASVGYEITPIDVVVSRSKLPIDEVLSRLTMLELRGLVSAVPGGYQKLIKG